MRHITIVVVIFCAISFGIPMGPMMITVALIVISIAITDGDVAEVDTHDRARGGGG